MTRVRFVRHVKPARPGELPKCYVSVKVMKVVIGIMVAIAVIMVASLVAQTTDAATTNQSDKIYQRRITVSYGSNSRKVSLSSRFGTKAKWVEYVRIKFNFSQIPTYSTAVGRQAAKAVRNLLVKAADMSWGANLKILEKSAKRVTWQVNFYHYYRGVNNKLRRYNVTIPFRVQVYMTKDGKLRTRYYAGSAPVQRASIETLLMKQSTTVNVQLGRYVPNVK